ncbi:hypothetical protein DXG03_003466 [Asterophora parasitica]|uniref:holo-[acyl-carrier-protein] synthase n=1 Tax=Asterophora parasitica TaxID=117018 RepID=A0A9P7GAT7_9AGAR|nr:hypothetical protein DXG03_003466 [Asterophora parasitica]
MEVWAAIYKYELFSEELYQTALQVVDPASSARIKRFYRREDACRTLIGRLMTRTLLKQRGISVSAMTFGLTAANKPYIANNYGTGSADRLTPFEQRGLLSAGIPQHEALQRFFWIWTIKEAYTKALGLGLGFDFRRVEYDVEKNILLVDKETPKGWRFTKFVLNDEQDLYEGVVAEYVGGQRTEIILESDSPDWLKIYHAVEFVEKAIYELRGE